MSTSDNPETDGKTERVNRVLEEIIRGYVHSFPSWSEFLPMAKFAIKNSVHASTSHTPFFVNGLRHPRLAAFLECDSRLMGWTRSRRNRSCSFSSHIDDDTAVDVMDADVDEDDVEATDTDDDVDDAGIFSIANDYSEDEHSLTDEYKDLSAVRTTHTSKRKEGRVSREIPTDS